VKLRDLCQLDLLLKGEIHVRRQHSGPMALFIGRAGQMTGLLPFSRMKASGGQGFAISPVWALLIHKSQFADMLQAIPSMAQRVVSTLLDRVRAQLDELHLDGDESPRRVWRTPPQWPVQCCREEDLQILEVTENEVRIVWQGQESPAPLEIALKPNQSYQIATGKVISEP